jgi:dihydrofolate reductase
LIRAILACDDNWGIGKDGGLPWPHNPADLKWFRRMTDGQSVVMGRKTWESLKVRPLPNRLNFVITSTSMENYKPRPHGSYGGDNVTRIIKDVIEARYGGIDDVWIIGGAQLIESCLDIIDELWLSRIAGTFDCDTFLPAPLIKEKFLLGAAEAGTDISVEKWIRDSD